MRRRRESCETSSWPCAAGLGPAPRDKFSAQGRAGLYRLGAPLVGLGPELSQPPLKLQPVAHQSTRCTKLSKTIFRPALSKSTVSLTPSTAATEPAPNLIWKTRS